MRNICWDCVYYEYDEVYDPETGDEWVCKNCLKGHNCDEDALNCEDFEE